MLKCGFTLSISLKHSFESNCPRNVAPLSSNQLYILSKQRLPTCLPAYLPTCLPAFLPAYLLAYLRTCLPTYLPTCIFAEILETWKNHGRSMMLGQGKKHAQSMRNVIPTRKGQGPGTGKGIQSTRKTCPRHGTSMLSWAFHA